MNKHRKSLGGIILQSRKNKIIGACCFLAALILIILAIRYILPEQVHIVETTLDGSEEHTVLTRSSSAKAVLEEHGYSVGELDEIRIEPEGGIESGATITLLRGTASRAVIGGETVDFTLIPGTVEENLAKNGITYDEDDIIEPALGESVGAATKIEVKEVRKESEEIEEAVAAKDVIILDPSLESGTIEETEGKDGTAVVTHTTVYINGKKSDTETEVKEWIVEGHDHVLRCGTSVTGEDETTGYTDTFVSNTAAYYFGQDATSAIGQACHYGTCAVDPSVIPYGTRLYVEGYGVAVANDSGQASSGTRIDVYMRSTEEAVNWGRHDARVFVLE